MFGSIRLGTVLGIPVGANWSVLFIAWLIAWSLAGQLLPAQVPGLESAVYWVAGAISAAFFLASLLAHELAHAIVARREGVNVNGITLWLLGGVARMDGEARTPGAEARIAGIGPVTSLGLALAFAAVSLALTTLAPPSDLVAIASVAAAWLAFVNLVLAVFNLLPGAPLDGGRLARAVIWRLRGDKLQATRWSTGLGQLLGYGLVAVGLVRAFAGDLGGIWFVLLGFFLSAAASAERQSAQLLESLRGVRVGEVMDREPLRVPAGLTVDTFAFAATAESRGTWLVTGPGGSVVGLLSPDALRSVRGEDRRLRRIGELAVPPHEWPTVRADELVVDVLQRLSGSETRAVVRDVDDDAGEIVGILSPEDISRTIAEREAAGDQRPRASRGDGADRGRVLP